MEEFSTYERLLFRELFPAKEGKDVFYFHEQYQLSPAQIYAFITEYGSRELVKMNGTKIFLTEMGRQKIWQRRFVIFEKSVDRTWRPPGETLAWNNKPELDLPPLHYKSMDKRFHSLNKEDFLAKLGRITALAVRH